MPIRHAHVPVGDASLDVAESGDASGRPYLFPHGRPESWRTWQGVMAAAPPERGDAAPSASPRVTCSGRTGSDAFGLLLTAVVLQLGCGGRQNRGMFCLEAVLGGEGVLRVLVAGVAEARVVPLGQGLSLLPMTDALADAVAVAGAPRPDGFPKAPAAFGRVLAVGSVAGPVAHVEAEYSGGTGTQIAQVWDAGKVVLGPVHSGEREAFPTAGSPISQALRRLGAARGDHFDEFEAVGLGRHRRTGEWAALPS